MSSNLPPGVTDQMIEDQATGGPEGRAAEAFADAFYAKLNDLVAEAGLSEDEQQHLCEWVWAQMGEAYSAGYKQGMDDESEANRLAHDKEGGDA